MLLGHCIQSAFERLGCLHQDTVVVMLGTSYRHIATDLVKDLLQRPLIDVIRRDAQATGHHAATDIHADGGRNNGLVRGDHRTDGRTDAQMHVRHGRDMMMDEWQTGDIRQLLPGFLVDVIGPDFHWHALVGMNLLDRHYWALQKWRGDKIVLTVEPFTDGSWYCVRTIPGMTCASCLPALHGACSQNSIRLKKRCDDKIADSVCRSSLFTRRAPVQTRYRNRTCYLQCTAHCIRRKTLQRQDRRHTGPKSYDALPPELRYRKQHSVTGGFEPPTIVS